MARGIRYLVVAVVVLGAALAVTGGVDAKRAKKGGATIRTAGVMENGSLISGTGAMSATREAEGVYAVRFPASVATCTWHLTSASEGNNQPPTRSFIRAVAGDTPDVVRVIVVDPDGNALNSPFDLMTVC